MNERRLIVSRHAVETYSRRRRDSRSLRILHDFAWNLDAFKKAGYDQEDIEAVISMYNELEQEIRVCVSTALEEGLALNYKPPGFVLYRRKKTALPAGQRFVRCDEDSNYGFIVKRVPGGEDVVITTLTRVGIRR